MSEQVTLEEAIRNTNDLRSRILAGEKIPREELKLVLASLRAGRLSAATTKKATKAKAAPIDLSSLFNKPVTETK